MGRGLTATALGLLFAACTPTPSAPPPNPDAPVTPSGQPDLTTVRIVAGLSRPVFVTAPPDDQDRLFILEQHTGNVRIMKLASGELNDNPFLTIPSLATGNEQGLLGMAFAPDYETSGRFYVNYTSKTGLFGTETRVARGRVSNDPDVADPEIELILSFAQPFSNHNGGWLGFGPDGYLYVATGDGGSANDPGDRAQETANQRLGKLLRLDVSGQTGFAVPEDNPFVAADGDDEIWAYGLRNPWRCSFDRLTGDLYIGDVGQGAVEEIDFQPAGSVGGEDYGWPCMEGTSCLFDRVGCTCGSDVLTEPVFEYTHADGCSVTGGYVYRGSAIPELRGTYFFADFCSSRIWSFRMVAGQITELTERTDQLNRTSPLDPPGDRAISSISSFGEDGAGELYICDLADGEVFKIVPATDADAN